MSTSTATSARRVKLPAQLQAVEDLLLWENVPKSAGVLGAATLLYLLLEWSGVPLLTWLSNLGLILVTGSALWAVGARIANVTGPADHLPAVLRTGFDEAGFATGAERLRVYCNMFLARVGAVLGGGDLAASARAFGMLWALGWLGRIVTPIGGLYVVVLAAFTLPIVYEMRKDEIDSAMGSMREAGEKHLTTAQAKAKEFIQRLTPQKGPRPAGASPTKME